MADLAVLFRGQELRRYIVHRNASLETEIVQKLEAFWRDHILADIPPAVDGSAAWSKHLKEAFKQTSDLVVRADPTQPASASVIEQELAFMSPREFKCDGVLGY